jgi:hypothetical protein
MRWCEIEVEDQGKPTGGVAATKCSSETLRRNGRTMVDGGTRREFST